MLTSRVATTATRINYRRPLFHSCFVALFKQTHPNSGERERENYPETGNRLRWRTLTRRDTRKWEGKKKKSQCIETSPRWKGGKFFPPRGMKLRDQRERGIEERKNFSLVTLPYLFWDSPRARHATRYRFSKGRRKSTLFDQRSGRWPGFDDTKVYETTFQWRCFGFFLLSPFDRVIAKFENRWILVSRSQRFPTERSSPARSKAQSWGDFLREQRYLVLLLELRSALVLARFSSDRLEDFLAEGITRILMHLGWGNYFLFCSDKSDSGKEGLKGKMAEISNVKSWGFCSAKIIRGIIKSSSWDR